MSEVSKSGPDASEVHVPSVPVKKGSLKKIKPQQMIQAEKVSKALFLDMPR